MSELAEALKRSQQRLEMFLEKQTLLLARMEALSERMHASLGAALSTRSGMTARRIRKKHSCPPPRGTT